MEQFEQLLTCAICLDRYRNPKLLPCQHSFCMEPCMDGLVDYVRRQVKCPECRAEHRIPYQGVQAFPTNVTLQRFLELHIEITGELPDPTSGQTMERCGVCSEKSYCSLCVHCEKKCCTECKDAHMDILRREITRINSQIRRGLHRLQDALALVEKNTLGLQTNCASVAEEVDEIYRRLSKALKDRTEHLRNEIERYSGTEIRGLIQLKENLELEIANIQSNCDLADAHINENVPWDDAELLDTKELFLRTVEFIRNFEYEAGDYGRRVRFVMAHEPNQLVLHVAGYGELNIKPETGTGGHLGTTGGLAPPGGSPGLMRSKSDHRLASQYRQQEEERSSRNRYVPDYEYDAPEYEAPRNKSRYRSRFMRHRDGEESDGDTRSTVRFTSTPAESGAREKVLDTEDAARGPLSGIFRLTDSPRVMKKLQECERAGKRKKEEPAPAQPPAPKPQVQVRKAAPTAIAKQVSEDDEISRIKKQNKSAPAPTETVEERQPVAPSPVHTPVREVPEREPEETTRRTPIARRTSSEAHTPGARSASSDSSTGSESSGGSGIRSTGAPFTAEEMKQKYLSRAPPTSTTTTVSSGPGITTAASRDTSTTPTSSPRPFQSRFLGAGNRAAPPPPAPAVREDPKKKEEEDDDDDEETTSSSEETESETEEESETEAHPTTPTAAPIPTQERQRSESAMARTDIGPLLARSAEARRGSKEDSPSTRYTSPRGSPALSVSSPTSTTASSTPGGYTSRIVSRDNDDDVNDDKTAVAAASSSSSSSSASSTDRIAQDNVNALTTRDDAVALNRLEPSNNESSESSESSSASDSESEETVRANNNLKSNENNKTEEQRNLENDSRANASLNPTLNDNRADNSKIESNDNDDASVESPTKKIVKFGSNGDADSIESTKGRDTKYEPNERDSKIDEPANSRQGKIDGNGDSSEHHEDRIDDFLARIVRDYNHSREDTSGRTRIIGSRVDSDRDVSGKDSIFDNAKPASNSISGISSSVQVLQENGKSYENAPGEAESGNIDSRTAGVTSDGGDSQSGIEGSDGLGKSKLQANSTNLTGSIDRFLGKIEEEDSSNETEPDNLAELENPQPKGKIQVHSSQAKGVQTNSDKTDEAFVNTESSSDEEESQDSETESEENSVRQVLDGSTDPDVINREVTDGPKREHKHFVQEKVENLFDDNGWVVTDEDLQPLKKETILPPIFSAQSNAKSDDNSHETDKTDFYNKASNSTESESSKSDDWRKLSTGKIEKSNSTIGNNGWLLSEESGSESERTSSSIEAINVDEIEDNSSLRISKMFLSSDEDSLKDDGLGAHTSRVNSNGSATGSSGDDHSWVFLNKNETEPNEGDKGRVSDEMMKEIEAKENEKEGENLPSRISETLPLRKDYSGESSRENNENSAMGKKRLAHTVDDDDVDDDNDNDEEEEEGEEDGDDDAKSNGEESQLPRYKAENGGALVTRRQETKDLAEFDLESDEGGNNEDLREAPMNIPMQMVTTVFCVSVLCYSVLTNLFL